MSRKIFFRFLIFTVSLLTFACTSKKETSQTTDKQVRLAIWGNYLPENFESDFAKKTGIKLNVSTFASNEELLAKIQTGGGGYDVVVPSDYMVEIMIKLDLLQSLDRSKLSRFHEISEELLDQAFDPKNKFSVPYAWSITGVATHLDLVEQPVTSWAELLTRKDLKNKVLLLDDVREVMGMALRTNKSSYNSTDEKEIRQALEFLVKNKSQVKMFQSDSVDPLVLKQVAAGQVYSTDANQAWKKSKGRIVFKVPTEGTTFAIDNLVIPKESKNQNEAHELINYILDPEIGAKIFRSAMAGPVLKRMSEYLDKEEKKLLDLFPPARELKKAERLKDLGPTTKIYDEVWTDFKTR